MQISAFCSATDKDNERKTYRQTERIRYRTAEQLLIATRRTAKENAIFGISLTMSCRFTVVAPSGDSH